MEVRGMMNMAAVKSMLVGNGNQQQRSVKPEDSNSPETIFSLLAYDLQNVFREYLIGTHLSPSTTFKNVVSEKAQDFANKFIEHMETSTPSLEGFGVAKFYLNCFFFEVTESGLLVYGYVDNHLVTPSKAGEILGVERQTINKYTRYGLEMLDTNKHKKIPLDALSLWKDPVWATRLQGIGQKFKQRNQSLKQYLEELYEELHHIETNHNQTLDQTFKEIIGGEVDAEDSIHFFEYNNWKNLLQEIKYVEGKYNGEHN